MARLAIVIYIDTNILIYLLEPTPYSSHVADIIDTIISSGDSPVSSTLLIVEFLAGTKGSDVDILLNLPCFQFIDLDATIAARAAELQRSTKLTLGDASHLAAALVTGCTKLITNDLGFAKIATHYIPVQTLD